MRSLCFFLFFLLTIETFGQQTVILPVNSVSGELMWIGGGTYIMGSPSAERGRMTNEGPQHQVTVSSFYMGMFPVTQAEYEEIMGVNPSHFRGPNLPVEQVSWFDAVEFCNKRSLKEGLVPAYTRNGNNVSWDSTANGYRLPTEAEWEYACRAGTQTPYYNGASVDDTGWYISNSGRRTHPVGEKQPNPWGLYDMHGNILEWCWDWLGSYSEAEQTDPLGASSGNDRVYRGGCWFFQANQTRSAYRFGNHPNFRSFLAGFRVARYP